MFTTKNPIDIIAAIGLGLGAVFGMAGTFVAQPALQAVLWALDGVGGTGSAQIAEINVARGLASRAFDFPATRSRR